MLIIKNIKGQIRYALEDDPQVPQEHQEPDDTTPLIPILAPSRNIKSFEKWYEENSQYVNEIIECYFAIILQYTQETRYRYAFDENMFRKLLAQRIYKTSDSRHKHFV
jgi:hypothetical protein